MSFPRPQLYIFIDWDETITTHDTLSLVAPPDSNEPNSPPPFSFFSEYYSQAVVEHAKEFGPRDTLDRQLDYLASLAVVENATVAKAENEGLFKGVSETDICERAKQVRFRDGWNEFADQVKEREHVRLMGILSANWSTLFIRCALGRIHDDSLIEQLEILANVRSASCLLITGC